SPRRSRSSAATSPTTSSTSTSVASAPRCRCSCSGTTTRRATTGTRARCSATSATGFAAPRSSPPSPSARCSSTTRSASTRSIRIRLVVADLKPDVPKGTYEAWANGDHGVPLGRELELASLISFIKNHGIRNVVWVTADVHYAQSTYYDPGRAQFADFTPFWEFVAGPINAGTFGPNAIDRTFGP